MYRHAILLFLAVSVLCGCRSVLWCGSSPLSSSRSKSDAVVDQSVPACVLGICAGTELTITVPDDPRLSGTYRVDESGLVFLGYAGPVALRGLTVREAADKIRKLLGRYLPRPSVAIDIVPGSPTEDLSFGQYRAPWLAIVVEEDPKLRGIFGPDQGGRISVGYIGCIVVNRLAQDRIPAELAKSMAHATSADIERSLQEETTREIVLSIEKEVSARIEDKLRQEHGFDEVTVLVKLLPLYAVLRKRPAM